ncbi:hypothetical protein J7T55_006909 [Diaporthe amygdali]|uniref:uncharacterized protein n=1 Tax=Phomopsis amygdali TaxID=1214568 RepID=UPI0022FE5031|nr:uncharacterized protein J7T55_006909 [Diaporthe amygdali]KAJ0107031.1 hypothetical protein J7T55_006909 [Diaporthe amygdali]
MGAWPTSLSSRGEGPAPAQQKINGMRLRTSCDACQNHKVKCSQHKPSCRRCSKSGLDCVYSPFRRMGRPKRPSVASSSPPIAATTQQSRPRSHDNQRRQHATARRSPASLTQSQSASHLQDSMEHLSGDGSASGPESGELAGVNGMHEGSMVLGAKDDFATGPYSGAILEDRSETTSFVNDGLSALSTGLDGRPALIRQRPALLTSPLAALVGLDSQVGGNEHIAAEQDPQVTREAGHCYLAILQRLAQLEKTMDAGPQPPRLDVVLSAERDTRALKERLFACQGHVHQGPDILRSSITPPESGSQSCIDAHDSSLLVLGLLADRVTSLLEDLFRRAAVSSHSMDQATRGTTASWLLGSQPEFVSQANERQYERSVRSSFPRTIQCPVPEANCELTIGSYEVDDEVKSRVMKLILKKRVTALERMLEDLKDYLMEVEGKANRPVHEGNGQTEEKQGSILLGSVRQGRSVNQRAAASMAEDLHRRAELLQGRLELAGY